MRSLCRATLRWMGEYKSVRGLALLVVVLLGVNGLLSLIAIGSSSMQLDLLDRIALGQYDEAEVAANDAREGALGILDFVAYLAAGIAFMTWFHRAYSNLDHFGHMREHGTGWAIGAWIVPIISLFRPLQMAREIWYASDPDVGTSDATGSTPPLLAGWWALWIIGNLAANLLLRLSFGAEGVESIRSSTMAQMALDALNLVTVPLAIMVVRELTRRQEARAQRMADGGEDVAKVFE